MQEQLGPAFTDGAAEFRPVHCTPAVKRAEEVDLEIEFRLRHRTASAGCRPASTAGAVMAPFRETRRAIRDLEERLLPIARTPSGKMHGARRHPAVEAKEHRGIKAVSEGHGFCNAGLHGARERIAPVGRPSMKNTTIAGVILIILGVFLLVYQGFSYTTTETVIDIGPAKIEAKERHHLPVPPLVGWMFAAGGIVLVGYGLSSRTV